MRGSSAGQDPLALVRELRGLGLGFATAGVEPYASLAVVFVDGWIAWLAPRVDAPTPAARRRSAAAMAQLDGLLLLRSDSGAPLADDAARDLGVLPSLPPGSSEDTPHRR